MHMRDVARGGDGLCAPILLLLPHEPLLLLPEDAAVALALALVLDACKAGATRGLVGLSACLPKGMLLTSHLLWHMFNTLGSL